MNTTNGPGVGCEIELKNGQLCGIPAIGRCATCGRAFCRSHQAWSGQTYYIDQCAPCLAKAQADKEKRIRETEAKWQAEEAEAREYFHSGSARTALLSSGAQPVNIYQTQRKFKKGFFSRNNQWVEVVTSVRRGWILSAITVGYAAPFGEASSKTDYSDQLTALLDLDHRQVVLTPVEPFSESYKEVDIDNLPNWEIASSGWIEAAKAVRQLIELHHLGIQSIFTRRISIKQGENAS